MNYITVADVDAILGANWAGNGEPARAVMMANTWLNQKIKRTVPVPTPDAVKQAGAEVAKDAAAGLIYRAKETGVTSKSVKADTVSSSKTFSASATTYTAGETFALALLKPWLGGASVMMLKRI
ncbi:hypothetical protein L1889_18295 [Paenalcaligenes niemegkensis]|uniref:hypothetical protein n=1 Tax=Paenalcaligenes niemegkensis TaxID=2895469 RepID=UPI001EE89B45|nr:hypothetical protein [Paenalcaligenes niemegkensis]MCQ9618391.1 hypothetical protein [Paenalcaligenes niemegkensis]